MTASVITMAILSATVFKTWHAVQLMTATCPAHPHWSCEFQHRLHSALHMLCNAKDGFRAIRQIFGVDFRHTAWISLQSMSTLPEAACKYHSGHQKYVATSLPTSTIASLLIWVQIWAQQGSTPSIRWLPKRHGELLAAGQCRPH